MKWTKSNAIKEMAELKSMLSEHGKCMGLAPSKSCVYVDERGVHPGCAIGWRLTEAEKTLFVKPTSSGSVMNGWDVCDLVRKSKLPEYFQGWPLRALELLQKVHDYFPNQEILNDPDEVATATYAEQAYSKSDNYSDIFLTYITDEFLED